ncbi:dihydrolipoyl dehydrogenase [Flavobacterium sp. LC2016-01]|uniref:dihydrolipoyl dehydrogenase n=1 Tax=Flavobacterium sp. LC2016-01 TaxID=2675876 RepID=UPI0012BA93CD|nr:dihydrolipoyl dehydrogenase [Flavobacterium sp. LC2016-01]MTH15860.1 dihydrolipoyl dehydrogenase [Flavobacterium sp. LC2016-01]
METNFDIIVIGSGPGGYVAAIRSAQLGYKTAIVEKYSVLGGTCTNVGCIPTKALLDSTEHFHTAATKFKTHGIGTGELTLDFQQMINRKKEVVGQNTDGLNYLMAKNKIQVIQGTACFKNNKEIRVTKDDNSYVDYTAAHFVVATGSKPSTIPGVVIDKTRIITSTEALSLSEKPKTMVIIGGGVIGVEMASIFARIGVKVTILEYAPSLIPTMDKDLGKELKKILQRSDVEIFLSQKVQSAVNNGDSVSVKYSNEKEEVLEITADYCLVAVGRKPYTEGLGLENTKIELDKQGRIITDERLRTAEDNIYAIGDVIAGAMLAHKAEDEGVFVAETINGQKPHINYRLIPSVVYTWPEVASVGYTEDELKAKNMAYQSGKFPFSASARARAAMEKEGFAKVLSDPKYGEILGMHIIGPRAADLIAQGVIGMEYEVTNEDMYRISYAHPTYSEALKEAYLISSGQGSINI